MAMGWLIKTIYEVVQNYGVAIILFTLLIKLILLPLNIKSQKSMRKQQIIQPIVAELQQKYANDQAKLQQEMAKVYKENNVSMAGGCLPMLIQMPILIALYQAIQKPLTYMFNVPYKDIPENIINTITSLRESMIAAGYNLGTLAQTPVETLMKTNQIQISNWAYIVNGPSDPWYINFKFLGLDLSNTPWTAFSCFGDIKGNLEIILLLIIPILAVVSSFAQSKLSMKMSGQDKNTTNDQAQSMSKTMTWMMPVMTGYFTLILPAGIGLYWIVSGIMQIVQQIVLNNYFEKKGDDFVAKVPKSKYADKHRKKSKKR